MFLNSHEENEILTFAAKWMEMEVIMLSEIKSNTEKQILYFPCHGEIKNS